MENDKKTITSLSDEAVKNKIRTLYLEGKEIKEILAILEIPKGTFDAYYYNNKYALRDFMLECKKEKTMLTCQAFSDKLMSKESEDNAKLLAIQQKEAEFLRETLLKDTYSKRIETFGLNINKNEPLDEDQKAKLDKLLNIRKNKGVDYTIKDDTCQDLTNTQENTPLYSDTQESASQ